MFSRNTGQGSRNNKEEIMQGLRNEQVVRLRWSIAASIAIATVILLKLAQPAAGADAAPEVIIDNYAFSPASPTVKVGTTVTWINHDDDAHTVDSTQGKFKSATLNKGDKFDFRFSEAGEYPFYCRFHPKMTGKIIVQP
jgi:plastocyanin